MRTFYLVKLLKLDYIYVHIRYMYLIFLAKFLPCADSSVGRVADFGSSDPGSNPGGATFFFFIFQFREFFRVYLVEIHLYFCQNFFSAPVAQLVGRRTLDPATRVRIPARPSGVTFFSSIFLHFWSFFALLLWVLAIFFH